MHRVLEFTGRYRFLSNFYPCEVSMDECIYPTVEHAYQAAKTTDSAARYLVRCTSPKLVKKFGRSLTLRRNWDHIKLGIMYSLVSQKFTIHEGLREQLIDTSSVDLIEGNSWGDAYWGVNRETLQGDNWLGRILMLVRSQLQA